MAVSKVAAVRKIHAHDGVARLQRAHVNGDVGLRAGVGLYVGVFGAEEFLCAINRELLDLVGEFAAAVITFAGIAFRVFVGEDRAHGLENGFRDEIFGWDEFEAGGLALGFIAQERRNLRINLREGALHSRIGFGGLAHVSCPRRKRE